MVGLAWGSAGVPPLLLSGATAVVLVAILATGRLTAGAPQTA